MNFKMFVLILLLAPLVICLAIFSVPFIFIYMIFELIWSSFFNKDKKEVKDNVKVDSVASFLMDKNSRLFKQD